MNGAELCAIVAVARDAAREAGALVKRGFRTRHVVEKKSAAELVTSFDKDSEALLRERLGAKTPFAVVGEEGGGAASADEPYFLVDPIDGTTNFVHGHPFWCVSIGLVRAGAPLAGVIVAPALGLEWLGWLGDDGARHAERRELRAETAEACAVSRSHALADALLATGFPYDRTPGPEDNFDTFIAIKRQCQAVRRCGSAALDLCLVADGTYDGYWERRLRPWDVAGGAAIVRAAGGTVTDFEGGQAFLTTGRVAATNGALHRALLDALARAARTAR